MITGNRPGAQCCDFTIRRGHGRSACVPHRISGFGTGPPNEDHGNFPNAPPVRQGKKIIRCRYQGIDYTMVQYSPLRREYICGPEGNGKWWRRASRVTTCSKRIAGGQADAAARVRWHSAPSNTDQLCGETARDHDPSGLFPSNPRGAQEAIPCTYFDYQRVGVIGVGVRVGRMTSSGIGEDGTERNGPRQA